MIAVYLRVSTGKQDTEVQKQDIDKYCKENNILDYTIYKDVVSGSSKKRPEYDRMKIEAKHGAIKKIIAYKIDRLGRRAIDLVDDMIFFFKCGCDIIFTSQERLSLSHDDPFSLTKIAIFAELAEMERKHISERTKLGLQAAKKRNPSLSKKKDYAKRAAIKDLLAQGLKTSEICGRLKCGEQMVCEVRKSLRKRA